MPRPRHILITGASSGLGAALALHYARNGDRLSLFGRNEGRLEAVAAGCRAFGADVATYVCDLRDADQALARLLAADTRSPIDLLVANAGVGGDLAMAGPTGESPQQAAILVETNLLGVINTVTPLLPRLVARGHGHIVLVGSIAGLIGLPHSPAYCAAKAGVHAYGDGLRRLLRGSGVGVTLVCPGFVETPMSASLPTERPFLWSAERAAIYIATVTEKKRRRVIFPWQLRWAVGLGRLLPVALVDAILAKSGIGAGFDDS